MAYEIDQLDLTNLLTLEDAAKKLKDPEFSDDIAIGYRYDSEIAYAIPDTESFIALRLGCDTDEEGVPYGINYKSTVLQGLFSAYGKKCSTKPEILIAEFRLDGVNKAEVEARYLIPLMATALGHQAVVTSARYDLSVRKATKNVKQRTELHREITRRARIEDNPYFEKPDFTTNDPRSFTTSSDILGQKAYRGTLGTV